MATSRVAVYVVVGLIVATTLATGPLVDAVELPEPNDNPDFGTGNATVTVTFFPDTVNIEAGGQGTNVQYLEVPAASVEIQDVRGNPILDYSLAIDELGYSRGSIYPVGDLGDGAHSIVLERDSFEPSEIAQQQYDGELTLTLRGDTERVVASQNVTVEVEG